MKVLDLFSLLFTNCSAKLHRGTPKDKVKKIQKHVIRLYTLFCFTKQYHSTNYINSLARGRYSSNFINALSAHMLRIQFMGISLEIIPKCMSRNTIDDKSTSARVITWYRKTATRRLIQCSPRSMAQYDATWPQWGNYILARNYNWGEMMTLQHSNVHNEVSHTTR